MADGQRRAWWWSLGLHGLVAVLAGRVASRPPPSVAPGAVASIEWTFSDPPPPVPEASPASAARTPEVASVPSRPVRAGAARGAVPSRAPSTVSTPSPIPPPTVAPATPAVPAPRLGSAAALLGDLSTRAMAQVIRGEIALAASPQPTRSRELFAPRTTASPEEQARAVSQGYVAERLAETHQHEAPGVRGYFWGLRRRMEENWRPSAAREPSLAETALATVAMPADMLLQVQRSAQGDAVTPGRRGAAIDALEGANMARGNNPANLTMAPFQGIVDAAAGNTRRTRAEVEVLQDEDGAVTSVRVLHSSGREAFDRAAEHAVREALPLGDAVAMPGGRRSRWSFEVVVSRDPFLPGVGMSFDESSGWVELHWPGRLHAQRRVWLESAHPAQGPRPRG